MRIIALIALLTCLSWSVYGQRDRSDPAMRASLLEQRIEQIAEAAENENLDFNTLFEQLSIYLDFPLNLNTADVDELFTLALLTNFQIGQFIDYRKEYGPLFSVYELPRINGWTTELAELISPFVTVLPDKEREKLTFQKLSSYGKHEIVIRWQRVLEEQLGYSPIDEEELLANPNRRYLGSPDRLFFRYRYRYSDRISFGYTGEKDAGEEFFRGSNPNGFDFNSAHIFLKDFGVVKNLALGDYQAQFGQGLTFWSGLAFNRKDAFATSTANLGGGLRPYTSINENLFLRGAATTLQTGHLKVTAFYSGKGIDATVVQQTQNDSLADFESATLVSAFQESGLHRTPREIQNRRAIFQRHFGGNIDFTKNNFHVGVTGVYMDIDANLNPAAREYTIFRFDGNRNSTIGVDYAWRVRNFFAYGETARSMNGGMATINGLNINMNPRLSVNITQRYYAPDFQPIAAVAFGEGSQVENEAGVYMGVEFRPFGKWIVNAFVDQFRFPWLRFQTDGPSTGYDIFGQIDYNPNSRTNVYFRYRERLRQINTREEVETIRFLVPNLRRNYRLNYVQRITNNLRLGSRFEYMEFQRGNEEVSRGFVVFQDLSYTFSSVPVTLTGRYALFQTDNFDSRIYAFENDVLYFFSIPAYSGRGSRTYLLAKYDINRNFDLWVRWAQFYYTDRQLVGTGLEEIDGNTRTEVKVQVRYKF